MGGETHLRVFRAVTWHSKGLWIGFAAGAGQWVHAWGVEVVGASDMAC